MEALLKNFEGSISNAGTTKQTGKSGLKRNATRHGFYEQNQTGAQISKTKYTCPII
jgi:hypothetical protein